MRVIETPTAGPWCWTCRHDLGALPEAGCCPKCGGQYDVCCNRILRHGRWARAIFGPDRKDQVACRKERMTMFSRIWMALITVLGTSAIIITFGVLGLKALFPQLAL